MKFTKTNLFFLSLLTGTVITVVSNWASHRPKIIREVDSAGIYVTDQIRGTDFRLIKSMHIATVETVAHQQGIMFSYIPVPHGAIPGSAVEKLSLVLRDGKRPILLYCRTGKRAIRTYCLAEASRKDGHTEDELVAIAEESGFSIDDLHAELQQRIAARKSK
jgi:uncharacterized protein (TIGR01244 family)